MKTLTDEIMNCLRNRLWYAALVLALLLPDICAALESQDGFSSRDRYKSWYDSWLGKKYDSVGAGNYRVTADDCTTYVALLPIKESLSIHGHSFAESFSHCAVNQAFSRTRTSSTAY